MAFFSVVIPSYNRSMMTVEAVNSVLNQTFSDYEIIVIDDGSIDDTEDALARFNGRIKYYKQNNSGVAFARNKGVSLSGGNYICYLDSDDIWHPDKLSVFKDAIESNPEIAFLFSDFHKRDIARSKPYDLSNSDMFSYIYEFAKKIEGDLLSIKDEDLLRLLFKGYPLYPSTFAIRRDVHDHFRWDPGIFKSEDFNFVLRLSRLYDFHYVNKSLTTVRVHDSNKSADSVAKDVINLYSMKLYRDLYVKGDFRKVCNLYISNNQFRMGKRYIKRGLLKIGISHLCQSLLYKENWSRLIRRVFDKILEDKRGT
ncbi:hypothetical protein C9993_08400 [Marinobacter sp. Z-F4-2]|nr:hypothetical protein C9993_08400 [Marinobacter sp. Z-F4-2]